MRIRSRFVHRLLKAAGGSAGSSIVLVFTLSHIAKAGTDQWNGTTSSWSNGNNWNPTAAPGNNDTVNVISAGSVVSSVSYDYTGTAVSLGALNVGGTSELMTQAAGILAVGGAETIGSSGVATYNQSGGSNFVTGKFSLGYSASNTKPTGNYYLSGNGLLSTSSGEVIGSNGSGNFYQSAGTNTADNGQSFIGLAIGDSPANTGTYTLSGNGQLSVDYSEIIGWFGSGVFNQTGGTHTVAGNGYLFALAEGGAGTYLLSGNGALSVASDEGIGAGGSATFNQSGGTNTITGSYSLDVGYQSAGVYQFSAGVTNVSAGGVYVGGSEYGAGGKGILTVSGSASLTMSGALTAFNISGSTINFSGGSITAASVNLNGYSSLLNWTGGTLDITGSGSHFGGTIIVPANGLLKLDGSITDPVAISTGGIFDLDANPRIGILLRTLSTITLSSNAQINALPALNVSNRQLIVSAGLTIAGTTNAWQGLLDLSDNDMDVQGGSLANVSNQIAQAYNAGLWNGTGGIVSTSAASDTRHLTTLGVILNGSTYNSGSGSLGLFDGFAPASGDVLVKFTWYGDTNLDGKVDGSDYSRIDAGAIARGSLSGWANGDFNYDGVINGSDYTLIDNAFNTQGAQINSELASVTAQITRASASVPEPASLVLLGIGAISLLRRRRIFCAKC